jgi:hypothetical protein
MNLGSVVMTGALLSAALGGAQAVAQAKGAKTASKYEVIQVTNGGAITGKVTFTGTPPAIKLAVNKDEETCHSEKPSPRLTVGAGGGVKNAIVFLEDVTKGKGIADLPAGSLDQKECEYVPHVQIHPIDKEFLVHSSDPILHNVNMLYKEGNQTIMNTPFPAPTGDRPVKKKFKKPGLAFAKCDAGHIWMSAFVYAVEHPYYAVTDAEGNFTIGDVPPGKYKLVMWHSGYQLKETQKDASGNPTAYVWSDDIVEKKDVSIEAGKTSTINFTMGGQS